MMELLELWRKGKVPCWECSSCKIRSGVDVAFCPKCGSKDVKMLKLDAQGAVTSLTIIRVPEERYAKNVPYGYCLVQGEGFAFSGWCDGEDARRLAIGSKVRSVSHDGFGLKLKPL